MKNNSKVLSTLKYVLLKAVFIYSATATAQTKPATKPLPSIKVVTPNDSLQYTLGAYLGAWITNNGFMVTNPDVFKKGMDDVLLNKTLLIDAASIAPKLDGYQKRMISQRSAQQERLLFENIKGKEGVGTLPSGVAYVIMKAGNGVRPQLNDSVLIHVKGFLPDGNPFEDTYAKKSPLRVTPAGLIPGMAEALQIMPVGSTWRLFVPSALGYAERGVPGLIPAYSALVFEVELMEVVRK
jgi:FKBP-type peptidyl-prolyl cis-trans isomerase